MGLAVVPGYPVVQAGERSPELFAVPGFWSPWVLAIEIGRKLELCLAVLPLQLFALVAVVHHRRFVSRGWGIGFDALFTLLLTQPAIGYLGVVPVRELLLMAVRVPFQRFGSMGTERLELLIADPPQRHEKVHIDRFNPRPCPYCAILQRFVLLVYVNRPTNL